MLTIDGEVCSGIGVASDCVKRQFPHLVAVFPEISDCHHGTINVSLIAELEVVSADYVTPAIKWCDAPPETFGFVRIQFEIVRTATTVNAWIYIPTYTVHKTNRSLLEVLAETMDVAVGDVCRIHLPAKKTTVLIGKTAS